MDKPAHTPGPWVATLDGDWWMVLTDAVHAIGDEDDGQLPVVDLYHGGYDYSALDLGSIAANAHLIAAAPQLLEALEGVVLAVNTRSLRGRDHIPSMREEQGALAFARAVIAKALGQETTP